MSYYKPLRINSPCSASLKFGTGFLIAKDEKKSFILTCYHVYEECIKHVCIGKKGEDCSWYKEHENLEKNRIVLVNSIEAEVVALNKEDDLVVLSTDKKITGIIAYELCEENERGMKFSIAAYDGLKAPQPTTKDMDGMIGKNQYQTSFEINLFKDELQEGNSGSPVIKSLNGLSNQVIGIVTSLQNHNKQDGYAIPISRLKYLNEVSSEENYTRLKNALASFFNARTELSSDLNNTTIQSLLTSNDNLVIEDNSREEMNSTLIVISIFTIITIGVISYELIFGLIMLVSVGIGSIVGWKSAQANDKLLKKFKKVNLYLGNNSRKVGKELKGYIEIKVPFDKNSKFNFLLENKKLEQVLDEELENFINEKGEKDQRIIKSLKKQTLVIWKKSVEGEVVDISNNITKVKFQIPITFPAKGVSSEYSWHLTVTSKIEGFDFIKTYDKLPIL